MKIDFLEKEVPLSVWLPIEVADKNLANNKLIECQNKMTEMYGKNYENDIDKEINEKSKIAEIFVSKFFDGDVVEFGEDYLNGRDVSVLKEFIQVKNLEDHSSNLYFCNAKLHSRFNEFYKLRNVGSDLLENSIREEIKKYFDESLLFDYLIHTRINYKLDMISFISIISKESLLEFVDYLTYRKYGNDEYLMLPYSYYYNKIKDGENLWTKKIMQQ